MKNEAKNSPLVSVIVPIYNNADYVADCVDSIARQTYQNLEIILVDDGSTDQSDRIADDYAKKDKRVRVIHQKNAGQSAARNRGLKVATGDYVSFVDGDDKLRRSFIKDLLEAFGLDTAVAVCGIHYKYLRTGGAKDVYVNSLRRRRKGETRKAYMLWLLAVDGRMYSSVNKLYRAQIAKTCRFEEGLNFAEDTKFVLDYLAKAQGEPNFVLKPLYVYNFGTATSTMRATSTIWSNWRRSYENLRKWVGKNPSVRERFWLSLVYVRWRISWIRSKRRARV